MRPLQIYGLAVWLVVGPVWSQQDGSADVSNVESERARIDNTRQQKTAELDAESLGCLTKFAVTDCQNKVSARRRQMLSDLKLQEANLNALERRKKGLEQLQRSADKAADSAAGQLELQTRLDSRSEDTKKAVQAEKVLNHQKQANPVGSPMPVSKATSTLDPKELEANRAAYAEKQKALEKRQKDRDQRLLDHGATGPALPVSR